MALGIERSVRRYLTPLVAMLGQELAGPPDEPRCGLVSGAGEKAHEVQNLSRVSLRMVPDSSSNSASSSCVMRSSDGCSALQSMYSAKIRPGWSGAPRFGSRLRPS